jgi:hypothetical protein
MKLAFVPLALLACGDNLTPLVEEPEPVLATCNDADLEASLAALPNVASVTAQDCGNQVLGDPRCFDIRFEQPIHHGRDDSKRFTQKLQLIHRGCDRPLLLADWGYESFGYFDDELSAGFRANALWIEHRYQGESVPSSEDWDWTALTIANGASDMHEIIDAFRTHYAGNFVTTGASKGGVTASYHNYLYPGDVDGSVPYVAPASRDRVDPEYQTYLDTKLPSPCAQNLRAAQVAALTTRRTIMLQATGGDELGLEYMIMYADWAFWQYYGREYCPSVPTAASSDADFFDFFNLFFGFATVAPAVDEQMKGAALDYEWLTEQGFALQINSQVRPLLSDIALSTMEDYFRAVFPNVELPAYDGGVTLATRTWARNLAENVLFIYGSDDPWSGGAMDVPVRASSAQYFVPGATHSAQIAQLSLDDRRAALQLAETFFGVRPSGNKRELEVAGATRDALIRAHELRLRDVRLHQLRVVARSMPAR